jgi:drug/metabolite transporter (DMT)-like permease
MATPATMTRTSRRKALVADLLLFSVAILWGSNFALIKDAVERTSAIAAGSIVAGTLIYLLFRYLVAVGIFALLQPGSWLHSRRRDWAMGGLLGCFYLTALILQTIGLQRTTPGVSGFITGMSVAMVPFLYWAVARRSPGRWQIVGAIVATVGLCALSLQGDFSVRWGDAITLVGAFFYALHIMTTGFFAPKVRPATLAFTQMAVSAAALIVLTPLVVPIPFDLPWQVWAAVVYTALTGTIYAFFIQSWAQRYTTSTHAAILLGFESVFAAAAGIVAGMDSITWRLLVGGSLMLAGVFIVELLPGSQAIVDEIEAEEGTTAGVDAGPEGAGGRAGRRPAGPP